MQIKIETNDIIHYYFKTEQVYFIYTAPFNMLNR